MRSVMRAVHEGGGQEEAEGVAAVARRSPNLQRTLPCGDAHCSGLRASGKSFTLWRRPLRLGELGNLLVSILRDLLLGDVLPRKHARRQTRSRSVQFMLCYVHVR